MFLPILSNNQYGQGFFHVFRRIQPNYPYPFPKTRFVVPPHSLLSSQCDSINNCGVSAISHKQPSHVSNLTTTMQVQTDKNNDDKIQSFSTPRKHHHKTPETPEKELQMIRFSLVFTTVYAKWVLRHQPHCWKSLHMGFSTMWLMSKNSFGIDSTKN